MTSLRPYQQRALDDAHAHFAAGRRAVLVQLMVGLGKTRLAAHAAHQHLAEGGVGVLFLVPRRELRTQARAALGDDPRIHVDTIQGFLAREDTPPVSLVVLDEARHYVSDEWSRFRERLPFALLLGLDATPARGDGRGLGAMFDALVAGIPISNAIDQGYLCPVEVLRPPHALEPGELAQDPVDAYMHHAYGTSAVIFAPSVELAQTYARALDDRGVMAEAVWGEMPTYDRDDILEQYAAGEVRVLCNVSLLTEGWDAPRTETVILARSFGTASTMIQAVGRGMRPHPGKRRCLVLDLRGVTHDHGEPDEERTWHLDGKALRRKGEGPDVRFCPVCGAVVESSACEECGHEGEMRKRPPRVLGLPIDRFARQRAQSDDKRIAALARWLRECRAKGWKPGRAYHRYVAVYGGPPPHEVMAAARRAT